MKSNLPRAVQKQADRADELIAQAKKDDGGKTGSAVAEPNLETITGDKGGKKRPDERQAPVKTDEISTDFKHKYDVLQAKYNAEVPALHQQVKQFEKQMADILATNERLSADLESLKTAAVPVVDDKRNGDSFAALEADDPEIAALFRKQQDDLANALAKIDELKQGQSKIDERFTTAEERSVASDEARFYEDVAEAVTDWDKVNVDPKFIDWLDVRVPGTVYTRQQLLKEAHSALDAGRVIELFKGYLEQKKSEPAKRGEEDLIDPTSSGGAGGGEAEKPTYTSAWIKSFYTDASKGKSEFSKERWALIDRDIQAAQVDGRIRD